MKMSNLFIHDINYVSARVGLDNWFDLNSWSAFRQPYSSEGMLAFGSSLASVIADAFGKTKKLLVCDLDNTLWGGVIGDDGAEGLHLGATTPKGVLFTRLCSHLYRPSESQASC